MDCTALHLAAYAGHARVVSLLMAHGANPLAKNAAGATARDLARMKWAPRLPGMGRDWEDDEEDVAAMRERARRGAAVIAALGATLKGKPRAAGAPVAVGRRGSPAAGGAGAPKAPAAEAQTPAEALAAAAAAAPKASRRSGSAEKAAPRVGSAERPSFEPAARTAAPPRASLAPQRGRRPGRYLYIYIYIYV